MQKYDHKKIEKQWKKKWEKSGIYKTREDAGKKKFYVLDMFPYPSGAGLHVGHPKGYIATDIVARRKMMQGYNVLHPMGWDAFGLPAENYAIKNKVHPAIATAKNIATFKKQLGLLGLTYDWGREINTTDPKYYKWTQWAFIQMFKRGLAYESNAPINWCPQCQTGLANEDLDEGKCERCSSEIIRKPMRQWVLKITEYADRLLEDMDKLEAWPEAIKEMQRNWIGRSEGSEVIFRVKGEDLVIKVFTTRPDTLFGATYVVLAPEHDLIQELKNKIENFGAVQKYIQAAGKKSDLERTELQKEKIGVELKGIKAVNPANNEELPIFVADYVVGGYGTGAIMCVPAHDERDWEFAKKYGLPIKNVVRAEKGGYLIIEKSLPAGAEKDLRRLGQLDIEKADKEWGKFFRLQTEKEEELIKYLENNLLSASADGGAWYADSMGTTNMVVYPNRHFAINSQADLAAARRYGLGLGIADEQVDFALACFAGDGKNINSQFLDGLPTEKAKEKMNEWLKENKAGGKKVNYKLRDWVFSRQRYWGEPIPLIKCAKCGWVPVPEEDLPLELPKVKRYEPSGTGESPLAGMEKWVNTKCPVCGGPAKRETNTMPQWAGSCWYYLRYIDPENAMALADKKKEKYWSPVDLYVGGAEHATRHLIYARFWHKFLFDIEAVNYDEPFTRLQYVGLILAEDGRKMSKRWGNVINPDDIVEKYGADSMRVYEMFMGPFDQACAWSTNGLVGARRFIEKVWNYCADNNFADKSDGQILNLLHKTIKKVTDDIGGLRFNTAISQLMIFVNGLCQTGETGGTVKISKDDFGKFLKIMAPFAPHVCDEMWQKLGNESDIFSDAWPESDPKLARDEKVTLAIQVNGKLREVLSVFADISEEEAKKLALGNEKIIKWLEGKSPKKIIYIKGKLISIVV